MINNKLKNKFLINRMNKINNIIISIIRINTIYINNHKIRIK